VERLKATGSSTALRRKLFPKGFAGGVMRLILETWQGFSLHRRVRLETRITALFRSALIDACDEAGRTWFIELEGPVTDPTLGTEIGRNESQVLPPEASWPDYLLHRRV